VPVAIRMPSFGQTTDELVIVAWLKEEGDAVAAGEPLLTVQTDKAMIEVESFAAGTLLKISRRAGEIVEAGSPIAYLGQPGEAIPEHTPSNSNSNSNSEVPGPIGPIRPIRPDLSSSSMGTGKILASPAARQLAGDHGIDLADIAGSGPEGRIETRDVQAVIARRQRQEPGE